MLMLGRLLIIRSAEFTSAVYEGKPWERKKRDKVRDRRRQWRQATERERERERERESERKREKQTSSGSTGTPHQPATVYLPNFT